MNLYMEYIMICKICKSDKNESEFENGQRQCKKCRYEKYKEKINENFRKYYENNKEKIKCRSCKLLITTRNPFLFFKLQPQCLEFKRRITDPTIVTRK